MVIETVKPIGLFSYSATGVVKLLFFLLKISMFIQIFATHFNFTQKFDKRRRQDLSFVQQIENVITGFI